MRLNESKLRSALLILGIALLLHGCGFQLRGQVAPLSLPGPMFISGLEPFSPMHRSLSEAFTQAGVELTNSTQQATSTLVIRDYKSDSRLFTLDSANRAAEYELRESLRFSLRSAALSDRTETQSLRVLRTLYRPNDQVLGRTHEEKALRDEMRSELARKILQLLSAQT